MGYMRTSFAAALTACAIGLPPTTCLSDVAEFHAYLLPETTMVYADGIAAVRFEVDSTAQQFNAYRIVIQFDSRFLAFESVEEGQLMEDACANNFMVFDTTDSTVTLNHGLLCGVQSIDGPGVLSIFNFRGVADGTSPLRHTSDPDSTFFDGGLKIWPGHPTFPRQVYLHDAAVVVVDTSSTAVEGPSEVGAVPPRLRVIPNPTRSGVWMRYHLDQPESELTLEILDVGGRRICAWQQGHAAPGTHGVYWSGTDEAGRRLPAGAYFWRLRSGKRDAGGKFLVVR